jgi:K+-sensing histidine kinase KdpD
MLGHMARPRAVRGYLIAITAVVAVTLLIGLIETRIHIASIAMLYLLAVLATATLAGRAAAIAASIASFLIYNWFFVEPLHTFQVGDPNEWFALLLLLVTGVITGEIERFRQQATNAEVLRRADELKTALLGAVSHDLRTPLASIIASSGSLRQRDVDWTPAEREGFLADIEGEARRLERIVANLLDLSRMESGTLRPERGWYDLTALVDDVLGRMRPRTAAHHLHVAVPDDLPPVPLDYVEIDQVLSNLIENAVVHTPPGTNVWIAARADGETLRVSVSDDGPGLSELGPRAFDAFVRAGDRAGSRGAGLGLAIARGLVEAHGGTIDAASREGGGAIITFALPLRVALPVAQGS